MGAVCNSSIGENTLCPIEDRVLGRAWGWVCKGMPLPQPMLVAFMVWQSDNFSPRTNQLSKFGQGQSH